jgi:hypothetical protein
LRGDGLPRVGIVTMPASSGRGINDRYGVVAMGRMLRRRDAA